MKRVLLASSLLFLTALNTACSASSSIEDLTKRSLVPTLGKLTGIVSASQQNQVTPQGYVVSSTVGNYHTGIMTTNNGYTVYSSVQGNMASETATVVEVSE